jgi:hypothetical protein
MNIKDLVSDNKKVYFVQYREGNFLYKTENGFEFPVPLNDIGNATLLAQDKAIYFMRYIRKHLDFLKQNNILITDKTEFQREYLGKWI